jgi:hypothetical protein
LPNFFSQFRSRCGSWSSLGFHLWAKKPGCSQWSGWCTSTRT